MERKALRKPIQRVVMVIRDGGNIAINDAVIDKFQIEIKVNLSVLPTRVYIRNFRYYLPNLSVSFPNPARMRTDGIKIEKGNRSLISQ